MRAARRVSLGTFVLGCALLIHVPGGNGVPRSPSEIEGELQHCYLDSANVEYIGGNLYDKRSPNHTTSGAQCCQMCHQTPDCTFWTFLPIGSCWLKGDAAWLGRKPAPGHVSGSTRPLPTRPPPAPPHPRLPPGPRSIQPAALSELPVGTVRPTGWLGTQLQLQVDGLSGHLPRFWIDIVNSTWLWPEYRWRETYSDRGGNLPYWLNGVIPLVAQLPDASLVDGDFNLSETVYSFTHQLLAVQEEHWGSGDWVDMSTMFSLGSWNVCRAFLLHASAHPHEARPFAAFIAKYVRAAHTRLLATGFTAENTVCTQCDSRLPESAPCSSVLHGGMCKPRWPDWAWILQEFLDSGLVTDASTQQLVRDHLAAVQLWGFDFEWMYSHPAASYNVTTADVPGINESFPMTGRVGCHEPDCFPATMNRHNVNMAMALKNGAVAWRTTGNARFKQLSHTMVDMLSKYHGQPTGQFAGDEHLAGRSPNRGSWTG